ncbi:DUF3606 domain-containing protein [Pelagibacterium sp. H642]|uniref:DUF3606 domain-containing protein n=1 Tax=Pelagibacterium sp. H642 TaxID=1881069 RepID=UPI0028155288|nr:DUF3606 domain-containing protein [Pelagibacterium sp. H642]WMT92764.1 DUF3606 domain-containing protein [Pelagibacterium sp. H642]
MADDPRKKDLRDGDWVAADQGYEVRYFAQQNGISEEQVRGLIDRNGNMRDVLKREAKKIRQP